MRSGNMRIVGFSIKRCYRFDPCGRWVAAGVNESIRSTGGVTRNRSKPLARLRNGCTIWPGVQSLIWNRSMKIGSGKITNGCSTRTRRRAWSGIEPSLIGEQIFRRNTTINGIGYHDNDPAIFRWSDEDLQQFSKVYESIWEFVEDQLIAHEEML